MFRLGRLDMLPAEDYGIRKGVASWYLERALDLEGK
jgi:3-methyladenine DNA glycosylase/8-oxoguanine DNA glycosylase